MLCKVVNSLGHIISAEGVYIDKARIAVIQDFPAPRNIKLLRSFIRFVNYDSRFCDRYSELLLLLTALLKKSTLWVWGVEQ